MRRLSRFGVWALLWLTACKASAPGPEEPFWGKQQCAHCMMLVSEQAPSAQALTQEGARHFFDDVGCLVAWEDREKPTVTTRWVRGPGGQGWVEAERARFRDGNTTPMDFGFLAAPDGVTFDEVREAVRRKAARR